MNNDKNGELVFCPLGGVGEIGMNFALYGYGPEDDREWIVVVIRLFVRATPTCWFNSVDQFAGVAE